MYSAIIEQHSYYYLDEIHNYRLVDTAEAEEDQYERYIFTVRRTFGKLVLILT